MAKVLRAANFFYRDREERRWLAFGFCRIPNETVLRRVTILVSLFFVAPMFAHAACPSTVPSGVTTCYYASTATGSDSNSGISESSPWAHIPGMPDCTGNCSSHTPTAGDGFILRGGDSWLAADLGVNWTWGGTTTNPIYIGVDQAWYDTGVCGTSWCRPIWNCQSTQCSSGQMLNLGGGSVGNVTFDNIEFTGYQETGTGATVVNLYGVNVEVENCYFHGWSHTSSWTGGSALISYNISNGASQVAGGRFHNNVVDGQDTTQDMFRGIEDADMVYDNVFRYTIAEIDGTFNQVYGNLVEHSIVGCGSSTAHPCVGTGLHCDLILQFGPLSGHNSYIYNNVVRNMDCPGGGILWINGLDQDTSAVTNAYNNVVYNVATGDGPVIIIGGHSSLGNTGTYYVYNNTLDAGGGAGGYCIGNGETGSASTTYYSNTHCIAAANGICNTTGTTCVDNGGNLLQTEAIANSAGYTSTETYAYSPTSSGAPTVGQGKNYASLCSGDLTALCSDTTYPTYDATKHTVVMRTVNARPPLNGGNWDIGAFEFSTSQVQAPQPPTGLQAAVH